jgi:hypothetical protein
MQEVGRGIWLEVFVNVDENGELEMVFWVQLTACDTNTLPEEKIIVEREKFRKI